MHCPFCSSLDHKVVDKRSVVSLEGIRRRRECLKCQRRFTTYEKIASFGLVVIKKDGRHELFDREKIRAGIIKALEKRPAQNQVNSVVSKIENKFIKKGIKEVTSKAIGQAVLSELKKIDIVAYLRFASVYRQFDNPQDFTKELITLEKIS